MPEDKQAPEGSSQASRWHEAAERLRSNARLFVVSLGAVAVTVVAGLSLSGLSNLDPKSVNFTFAVIGALLATLGVVIMLALAMRLSSASAVTMEELLALGEGAVQGRSGKARVRHIQLRFRQLLWPGYNYARKVVDAKSNGYLAGYNSLAEFDAAIAIVHKEEREKGDAAAASPDDTTVFARFKTATIKAAWYDAQLRSLVEVASFQRLRWNFGATAVLMTLVGAVTAVGIVMYAAALQPRGVSSSPVAVTTHEGIQVEVPENNAASALYNSVLGCSHSVQALVLGVSGATVSAITIPDSECRSVTLNAEWNGSGYVAKFDLPKETSAPRETAAP